ncbi:MAG: exosortase-associated EpsI family protein [Planctomycetota bacterium]
MNPKPPASSRWLRLVAPALASALLVGMAVANAGFPTAEDAEPYHARIMGLSLETPTTFGPWESRPIPVPTSAVELLRPNAMLSRQFRDTTDRRHASILIVQCKDARGLSGHWPPNCYKASGYTQTHVEPRQWPGLDPQAPPIPGVEYTFDIETEDGPERLVVANFLIVPGVGLVPDMASVRDAGADPQRRSLGAAQVQVVTDGSFNRAERDAIFAELLEPHAPLINAILDPASP